MEVLASVGKFLFVIMAIGVYGLNIFAPKWYWDIFIPKLHQKEHEHPVFYYSTLLLLIITMIIGVMSAYEQFFNM